jgi:polar amino acid transport system substrate-binding protein
MQISIRLFLFVSLMSVLQGRGVWAQPYPSDIQKIVEKNKIVVAMIAEDFPPILMTGADGCPEGFEVRLARDIAKELGVKVEFVRKSKTFDNIVEMVAKKEADLGISLLTINVRRAKIVSFSQPYLVLRFVLSINRRQLLTQNKKHPWQNIRETTATIGVLRGSANVGLAQVNFPHASLKEFDSWKEMVEAATKGEIFAILSSDLIKIYFKENPSTALHLEIRVLEDLQNPIGIAVHPDSPHLLSWINVYLFTKGLHLTTDEFLEKLKQ